MGNQISDEKKVAQAGVTSYTPTRRSDPALLILINDKRIGDDITRLELKEP
jgi:hypothetical protein